MILGTLANPELVLTSEVISRRVLSNECGALSMVHVFFVIIRERLQMLDGLDWISREKATADIYQFILSYNQR